MNKDSAYQQLRSHLAYLNLAAAAEALPTHLERARQNREGHTEFLEELLRVEVETTEQRRWATRLKLANFPTRWQLEDFDFGAQPSINEKLIRELVTGAYLADATNVLFIGPPGVGKTMLAVILGRAAVDTGHKVYYTTAADLAARCRKAALQGRWARTMRFFQHPESVDHRRTGLPANAGRRRRHTFPSDLQTLRKRIDHPHHQPRRDIMGRDLLRSHHRRGHARPAPPQERGIHHHRGQLPPQKLPSTSQKTPTERRPTNLKPPNPGWGISVIDSGENR